MANLQDVIERMKKEGQLTRNSPDNSIKTTNRILGEMNSELVAIGKSLGAIRTVGGLGGGQAVQVVGGGVSGGGTAAAETSPVSNDSNDPQGIVGLLGAAIRNQTVGRVERGAAAVREAASTRFQESAIGRGVAATQQFVSERVEGTREGLRGLAGIQTNAERDELLRQSVEEENATRESIDRLVELQTEQLGLSEREADALRQNELRARDLASGGSAAPTASMVGAGATGGGAAGGGAAGGGGSGGGKMGGMIGKFFGGLAGGALAGFVMALGNPALLKAAAIFALVLPLIGVGLAGFIASIGAGFGLAAAAVGKGLEVLNEPLKGFAGSLKTFEGLNAQTLAEVGNGLSAFFDGLPGVGGLLITVPEGLDGLADALVKMNDVNPDKLKVIGPAVEQMGKGLMAAGLGEVFSTISSALGGEGGGIEGQMESLANGFRQFSDINADDVAKIGPAVKNLGEGLKAAADSDGFGNALGGIVKGIGSFFGAEEADPIEMFKKFAVLGEGEMGTQLETAGKSLAGLGQGLSALNDLDTSKLGSFAEDILPPLTNLTKAFDSEVFMVQGDPMGSLVGGLVKMKELEALEGIKIKTNLEAIGEGLESFADSLDDGEIETLAEYVKQVAGPILSLTGSGGGAGGEGGGAAGQAQGGDSAAMNQMQSGGGRTDGAAINGASREIAAGQRGEGGANVNAPTDNSNNSTNITNNNNGGGGGPPPSPRRSQHRGGMYDRP